jgi:hypothetical protein
VKVIILSVIQNYLLLTVAVENTAVKFVMREYWRKYRKTYRNNPREMSQITSPFPFVHPFLRSGPISVQNSTALNFPEMPIIKVT